MLILFHDPTNCFSLLRNIDFVFILDLFNNDNEYNYAIIK